VWNLPSNLEHALGDASSGLARIAAELGAEAVAVFVITESKLEVSYVWSRTGKIPTGSRLPGVAKAHVDALSTRSGVVEERSTLAKLLRESLLRGSRSFLLFPWSVREQVVNVVFGFASPQPRYRQLPDAVAGELNLFGLATWSVREVAILRAELQRVYDRLAGRKVVERAKGVLQEEQGLSEELAYAYLRRESRRRRITLFEIAEDVLRGRGRRAATSETAALLRDRS